ncbi:hypothetical protein MMAG44476_12871 [Mycolicibacterium mageritense DSM 44476 = CIP 104973]|uniref:Uncharacterized protein n=1 Tax=Mycolicibacterium mageritense TaxID=53462 RepID=A0ABM7HU73_MYCME|nr:DUF5682 family protein [Mycolicibacterium mageritense]MCC9181631.1 DUF5682 family protein [Mycolicibacterium mageritense]BBX34137.1 hypothetical protein MMAGJ_34190 [Mycolicibacterium mageritense]
MTTHVLGVRHHGPGSARAVVSELDRIRPDIVVIEGPADANALTTDVDHTDMVPPVAIMAYAVDDPAVSAFWPFGGFSPEWQALQWAAHNRVPVRFCDLPAATVLAQRDERHESASFVRIDPIGALADAAGYDDPERWWDDVVESRTDGTGFDAITEAMRTVRELEPAEDDTIEHQREAHMRQVIRKAVKEFTTVVVVCGAWHAPALAGKLPAASADSALLRGLPKVKCATVWVPWTHSRLAAASGYGAGVRSPGWYQHAFVERERPVETWLTLAARALRNHDIFVSSAHVIEGVRLANALAAMRGRAHPGLSEVNEATEAVLCEGSDTRFGLIVRELVVGERLGSIPEHLPMVPLLADITKQQRSLRLKPDATAKQVTLDLRKPNDLAKSHLLHRLAVLDIPWGEPEMTSGQGTFKEAWTLQWLPEFAVKVVVSSVWGNTVCRACKAKLVDTAENATHLGEVTAAIEAALLGGVDEAVAPLLAILENKAAVDRDLTELMAALPALARSLRYGDVRRTDAGALGEVTTSLLRRVNVGLPATLTGLGPDAAAEMLVHVNAVTETVDLLDVDIREEWLTTITRLADRDDLHGSLVGRFVRIGVDGAVFTTTEAAHRMRRALSVGAPADEKSAWIEGFLSGSGLLLVHDTELLSVIDEWLIGLTATEFTDVLPLVRRTFSTFDAGIKRNIGHAVATAGATVHTEFAIDAERARPAVIAAAAIFARGIAHD